MSGPTIVHPPVPGRGRRRRRSLHLLALAAAALYGVAAWSGYRIVDGAVLGDAAPPEALPTAGGVAGVQVQAETSQDALALEVVAARTQRSVFAVTAARGGRGTAFVAWATADTSYLVTTRATLRELMAAGGRTVVVHGSGRAWTGRLFRADPDSGLVLFRVHGRIADPLWQQRRAVRLVEGAKVVVVVPGGSATLAQGTVASVSPTATVTADVGEAALGAPVLDARGRLAGVVAGVGGVSATVAPIERACDVIRRCA